MGRRIALVLVVASTVLTGVAPHAHLASAQPAEPDIEMDPAGAGSGSAQAPAPVEGEGAVVVKDPKVAKKWQTAAVQLVQKGDYLTRKQKPDEAKAQYENAVTAYTHALEASDDLNLAYDLGLVEEKLGHLDLAALALRRVTTAKAGVRPDVLKKATAKFDDLSTKVGLVTLTVNTEGATIMLGDKELGKSPLPEPLVLMPGSYTLSFSADGFQPKDSEIKVEAGSESERAIELDPIKIVVEPIKADPDAPVVEIKRPQPSKLPMYIGAGAALGLGTVAVITGILAVGQHSTFVAAGSTAVERADAQSNGRTLAHTTDILLGSAVVAGGFTAYWYFFKYKPAKARYAKEQAPSSMSKVDVAPWVQPGSGGFVVAGSF